MLSIVDEADREESNGASKTRAAVAEARADTPLAEVGRAGLADALEELDAALGSLGRADDHEAIHDARVATRRLRAVLQVLRGIVWRRKLVGRLRRRLAVLARALGAVRDADVFLRAFADGGAAHEDPAVARAVRRARRLRRRALADLALLLESSPMRRLLRRLRRLTRPPRRDSDGAGGGLRVVDRAGSLLWRRYEVVRSHARRFEDITIEGLHALRIDVKNLRYALELFQGIFGQAAAPLVANLVGVQDRLGHLHDAAMSAARLEREDPTQERRMELGHRYSELRADALTHTRRILDKRFGASLLALVSAL